MGFAALAPALGTAALGAAGLFASKPSSGGASLKALNQQSNKVTKNALSQVNVKPALKTLSKASDVVSKGLPDQHLQTPGLGIDVTHGNVNLVRGGEVQNLISSLSNGQHLDEKTYTNLISQLKPGFGAITNARRQQIENTFTKSYGDLKDSLAQRRIAGSSWADNALARNQIDKAQAMAEADAQSFADELNANVQLIQARTAARSSAITTALSQANFESGIGAQLIQSTQQANAQTQALLVDIAKTSAGISANAASTKGNLVANVGTTATGQYSNYAKIAADNSAGQGALVGNLGSKLLFGTGGSTSSGTTSGGYGGLLSAAA